MATSLSSAQPAPPESAAADSASPIAAALARLKANALASGGSRPLRGRNIGILCEDPHQADARTLQDAAGDLGARVSLVHSNLHGEIGQRPLADTARVLERLYDAVICVDLAPEIVEELRTLADIPVLSGVTTQWRDLQASRVDASDSPGLLLQALLASICI
jgi:ornithine carbamoyltransferase